MSFQSQMGNQIDAINQWVERRTPELSNKAVCILTGGAGTGKCTIASEFARRRDDKHDYGASFFFVRGVADLDSTRLVFPTLAYQLAQPQDALRAHIVNAVHEHLLGDYPGFVEDGLDELLSEGSSEFAAALQPLDDLYMTVLEIAFPSKDLAQAPRLRQALESTLGLGNIAVLRNPMSPAVSSR